MVIGRTRGGHTVRGLEQDPTEGYNDWLPPGVWEGGHSSTEWIPTAKWPHGSEAVNANI